jgi:hypothetical protein
MLKGLKLINKFDVKSFGKGYRTYAITGDDLFWLLDENKIIILLVGGVQRKSIYRKQRWFLLYALL